MSSLLNWFVANRGIESRTASRPVIEGLESRQLCSASPLMADIDTNWCGTKGPHPHFSVSLASQVKNLGKVAVGKTGGASSAMSADDIPYCGVGPRPGPHFGHVVTGGGIQGALAGAKSLAGGLIGL
jgi:hypothetical protein